MGNEVVVVNDFSADEFIDEIGMDNASSFLCRHAFLHPCDPYGGDEGHVT